ncbi:MAG TPA: NlpC/P60 family protein [Mycobacteriales bacterium]|nr:NlpC/P60 family protein [Mycobacteriales bacterium]
MALRSRGAVAPKPLSHSTDHSDQPARSAARRFALRAAVVAAGLSAMIVPAATGSAAPSSHLTLAQAKAQVAALNAKAERITEAYDSANTKLSSLQRQARITGRELGRDQSRLDRIQWRVGKAAAAAYRSGGFDVTMSLISTGSAQTFLDQTSSLNEVASYERDQVAEADAAQRQLAQAKQVHDALVSQQQQTVRAIGSQKSSIERLLAQQKQVLSRLTAAAHQRYVAQQQAVVQHAVTQRQHYTAPTYNGPATGSAAAAVSFAYAQLGKPYVYGGAGPSAYDCSGLTMRAWGAAGVALAHNAAAQQASVPAVSLSDLQPGDLVFFGRPAYHVGIYIGGGRMIHAPHTGTVVQITSLAYFPPTSAGRP